MSGVHEREPNDARAAEAPTPDAHRRVLRALHVTRGVVHAQLEARDENEYLGQVCAIVVRVGGYRLAWIGYAERDEMQRVKPVAMAGVASGYLENIDVRWSDTPRGQGPTGAAIRTRTRQVARDILHDPNFEPWRADALARNYASSIALPLMLDDACIGALSIYAVEPDAFDDDEERLLGELADMVSQAIGAFRAREERAHAEREQRRLEAELNESRRLEGLGRLAGGIAHDFNNLLAVMMNFAAIAAKKVPSDHPVQHELHGILETAQHGATLTRQLVTFSSREADGPSVVDPNGVITTMQTVLERLVGDAVRFEMRLGHDAPAVRIIPAHLEQILMNAASNARDAMRAGGTFSVVTERVELRNGPDAARTPSNLAPGTYLRLVLEDTGVGMTEHVASRAFEPFFTTKDDHHGTGLGLSIVYGAVHQAGGVVAIHSEPGRGTRLEILLPAAPAAGA